MTISSKRSKGSQTILAAALIAGMNKHFANVPTVTFASATHTPQEIVKALQSSIDLRAAVDVAKSAVEAKLADEQAQLPAIRSLTAALVAYLKATFSGSPDVLADFGLKPRKAPTPLTTEQQAVAVAKRKATRKARGTTGSKAKKGVHGNVVDVVVTPVTATPTVATSSAPGGSTTPHGA